VSVTAASGFVAAGVACGVKASGGPDLALVATADGRPVPAAAVFTSNQAAAAPVIVSRRHLEATGGRAAAVVLNSGNANAATGEVGVHAAHQMAEAAAALVGCQPSEVLVCSTGLIGIPLPVDRIVGAVPGLVPAPDGGEAAATAIMTTDTHPKQARSAVGPATLGGMAKGAAMLAPDMATMLAVLTTDAALAPERLGPLLSRAVAASFNRLSVDGCTSTNDTVILLAGGRAGPVDESALERAVTEVCLDLARQMAADAEGATKVVTVRVTGAASDIEAERAARKVAESQLVKCSWYGQDPYWGRVVSELGSAGVRFQLDRVAVAYGGQTVCRGGRAAEHDEAKVKAHMAGRNLDLECDLGMGPGDAFILTNDLTHAYIDENMGTS
jgi:glutamate N-acetyltransferase / amino-acid N-acetyltransferase